jgi:hypothetical protein
MTRHHYPSNRVHADSVADFLDRYYKHDRYRGRDAHTPGYSDAVLASHKEHFVQWGYDIISRHESVTGEMVSYYGPIV